MAEITRLFVTLKKGQRFVTPHGVTLRAGVPLRIPSNSPHLAYFRASSRFSVSEDVSVPRTKRTRRSPVGRRSLQKQPAKTEEVAETPITRKQLIAAAKELGIVVRSSNNKADIVEMIEKHKAGFLAKAEKDAAAAAASKLESDGGDSGDSDLNEADGLDGADDAEGETSSQLQE